VADADETARKNVLDEAAQKLHRRQRHRRGSVLVRVVFPLEGDAFAVEGAEPVIADGDAVRVAPQVAKYG
jgi:hypothetical protein